jgi:hypothetical protein
MCVGGYIQPKIFAHFHWVRIERTHFGIIATLFSNATDLPGTGVDAQLLIVR